MSKYVAYFRVSTARQRQSGLGLEVQQAAVLRFLPADAVRVVDFIEGEEWAQERTAATAGGHCAGPAGKCGATCNMTSPD
jgi:hypothetical protein